MRQAERAPAAGFDRRGQPNMPRPLTPAERQRVEELITQLIELLDQADGDPDFEPSLGWSRTFAQGPLDTSELFHDLEEDGTAQDVHAPW